MMELTRSRDVDWDSTACLRADPEIFYPDGRDSSAKPIIEQARGYCGSCEIKDDCLRDALARDEEWGIWGGMTERERKALRRRGNAGSAIMRSIAYSSR